MKKENKYQMELKQKLETMYPEALVLKIDTLQGFPDLVILYKGIWGALETKRHEGAHHQPNQDYYVDRCNQLSFGSFICPENEREVLDGLQQAFKFGGSTRISKRK